MGDSDRGEGVSRRDYLLTGGLAGALAASAGCLGVFSGSGPATAVDELLAGKVVAVGRDRAEPTAVDPETTERPIQDALDLLAPAGGEVRLPPTTVFDRGPVRPYSDTALVGFGPDVSKVAIGSPATDGLRFDRDPAVTNVLLDGFALNGPGLERESGVAIHHAAGDTQNLVLGRLVLWGWTDAVYRVDEGVGPFQCRHGLLVVYDCDASSADGLFEFRSSYGPANWFGTIAAYPSAAENDRESTVWATRGGAQSVDHLTIGGACRAAVDQTGGGRLRIEHVHWEPETATPTPAIVRLRGAGQARIGGITHAAGTAEYAYELGRGPDYGTAPAANYLGPYSTTAEATAVRENVVTLTAANDPTRPSFYEGVAGDVDVTHGEEPTGGLRALGGAGTGVG
jgi:hypothetical protein